MSVCACDIMDDKYFGLETTLKRLAAEEYFFAKGDLPGADKVQMQIDRAPIPLEVWEEIDRMNRTEVTWAEDYKPMAMKSYTRNRKEYRKRLTKLRNAKPIARGMPRAQRYLSMLMGKSGKTVVKAFTEALVANRLRPNDRKLKVAIDAWMDYLALHFGNGKGADELSVDDVAYDVKLAAGDANERVWDAIYEKLRVGVEMERGSPTPSRSRSPSPAKARSRSPSPAKARSSSRPPTQPDVAALAEENAVLRRENAKLKERIRKLEQEIDDAEDDYARVPPPPPAPTKPKAKKFSIKSVADADRAIEKIMEEIAGSESQLADLIAEAPDFYEKDIAELKKEIANAKVRLRGYRKKKDQFRGIVPLKQQNIAASQPRYSAPK